MKKYLTCKTEDFKAGSIKYFIKNWIAIMSDEKILESYRNANQLNLYTT